MGRDLADLIVPPTQREGHRKGLARYMQTGNAAIVTLAAEQTDAAVPQDVNMGNPG